MPDKFSKSKRSEIMAKIRSKNTKPEIAVRRIIYGLGYRYRLHRKDLPGTPDIVISKYKLAINVNGCFWHECPHCKRPRPRSNPKYWDRKLSRNINRDQANRIKLERMGWYVATVWGCETRNLPELTEKLSELLRHVGEMWG